MTNWTDNRINCHGRLSREKALIINNHGKPAARFSPRADVDDGRMGCIWQVGLDRGDDCPHALIRPLSIVLSHTRMIRALSVRVRIVSNNNQSIIHSFIL